MRELERSFAAGCERNDFRLCHYSIQGNHAHLIVEADNDNALGRGTKALGSRLARAVNRVFGPSGPVLADRYHLHVLRSPREVRSALAYVLLNSRRHTAKAGRALVSAVQIDPASSGRWFAGWSRRLGIERFGAPSADIPRSWLLTVGWTRSGLLDPDEIPGR